MTWMTFQTTWKCIVQGGNRTTKGAVGLLKYWPLRSPVYTQKGKKRENRVKDLLYGQKENFSCGAIAGNPARAYLTRLSYQSEGSLRAGSPFGRYRNKYTRKWHARGDATKTQHSLHLAHSRIKPYNETPDRMHWGAGVRRLKKKNQEHINKCEIKVTWR